MKLSVLDQSPIARGETASDAIAQSIELAKHCESFGYHRYWLAEHHASSSLASSTPEILITRIANETSSIRVGSGGVMLSHYSPYKVAENFRMLELMFPNRIDLGVGRAPGSDGLTAAALSYGNQLGVEYYPAKVKDLTAFVTGKPAFTEAFGKLTATPDANTVPELWMLGSSLDSAHYAAEFGLAFSFAHFIAPEPAVQVMNYYRDRFKAEHLQTPYSSVGIFAIVTEDEERADLYRRVREIQRIRRAQGVRLPAPTLEEAADYEFTEDQKENMRTKRSRQLVGTPDSVKQEIETLVTECRADEVVVLTITPRFEDRVRSYELLARAFTLARASQP